MSNRLNFQIVGVFAMPTDSQAELARCRGVRRMHLRTNIPARVQAPGRQFGSSAHGSLLRAFSLNYRKIPQYID